jgi:hypothetical protein
VACALLLCSTPVAAGPPYATDDPEPVEYRHWEFYVATHCLLDHDGDSGTAPHFEVNYGVVRDLQLHLVVPLAYARPDVGPAERGLGDIELGAKLRFRDEGPGRPMMGIFPLLELPTGDAGNGLGSGHVHAFVPLWIQRSVGPWTTYGGGGYGWNPGDGNRNWWFAGWLAQRRLSKAATLGGEVFRQTPDRIDGSGDTRFNLGLVLDFGERHHLLLSAGRSLAGDVRLEGYAAYQLTL